MTPGVPPNLVAVGGANQPNLVARKMLLPKSTNALRRAVGNLHAHASKARWEFGLGAELAACGLLFGAFEHLLSRMRDDVGHMVLA